MNKMSPSLIDSQVETLAELYAAELPKLLLAARTALLPDGIRRVYALGNGDSHHAALAAAQAFSQWTDVEYLPMPAYTFFAAEMNRMDKARAGETLVACVSASGSSKLSADILNSVRARGLAHTLSIAGSPGCLMDQCADWRLSAAVTEKGRSPGIRTYAASLCALLALAGRLGSCPDRLETLSRQISASAYRLPLVIDASRRAAETASGWDWPLAMVLGCDGLLGCAQFIAAKFAEGCGVFAASQEIEEWCHVESMTYPLNAPVILLLGAAQVRPQVLKAAAVARRAGRPVLIVGPGPDEELASAADVFLPMNVDCALELQPLYDYVPGVILARALAEKLGRSMFLSDLPISLF